MNYKRLVIVGGVAAGLARPDAPQRWKELPRDREIIAYCQTGQCSYHAAHHLSNAAFACAT